MGRHTWVTRVERDSDRAAVHAVARAAFDTPLEAELIEALRRDAAWVDGLSLVATAADGTVVGHALLTRCHIGEVPALCLAPVAVIPAMQSAGVGTAVVQAVLRAATGKGERFVTVLGHADYYPRFGFTRASTHGISVAFEVPDEALMALALQPDDELPSGIVRYATPFGV